MFFLKAYSLFIWVTGHIILLKSLMLQCVRIMEHFGKNYVEFSIISEI